MANTEQREEEVVETGGGELVPRQRLADALHRAECAVEHYRNGWASLSKAMAEHQAAAFSNSDAVMYDRLPADFHREVVVCSGPEERAERADAFAQKMRRAVHRDVWRSLVQSTPIWSLLDAEEHKRFEASISGDDVPDVTEDAVEATLARLSAESGMIFRRGLVNAFKRLCREYKSNDGFRVGERQVITHACDHYGTMSFSLNYHADEELRDVDRIAHILDGQSAPDYQQGLCAAVRQAMKDRLDRVSTPYWRARWFKNGNMHLWSARPDLLDRINVQIATYYGAALGNDNPRRSPFDHAQAPRPADEGHFPSPPGVVARVIELAGIEPGMRVLEPSAGDGALVNAAADAGGYVYAVELDRARSARLAAAGRAAGVFCADFLAWEFGEAFDRVAMNPPFAAGQAWRHVRRAYDFLRPGGRLVAVVPDALGWKRDTLVTEFRDYVNDTDPEHEIHSLPVDAFSGARTRVRTCVLVWRKREAL